MTQTLPFWPRPGTIDLVVHDRPHAAADTEWWYVNSHVRTADGRALSLFAAFFRIIDSKDEETGAIAYAHSLTWAITDATAGTYVGESRVDKRAPEMGLERIKAGRGSRDERLNRAMAEILEQGRIPTPDRVFDGPVVVATDRLRLDYGGAHFERRADGGYHLRLVNERDGAGVDIVFHPEKPAIRHGDDGVVRGADGEQMFYYFVPRCRVEGTITVDGEAMAVESGQGWYDHEFGGYVPPAEPIEIVPEQAL